MVIQKRLVRKAALHLVCFRERFFKKRSFFIESTVYLVQQLLSLLLLRGLLLGMAYLHFGFCVANMVQQEPGTWSPFS